MPKRGNSEGSIYKRADGRYEARIVVGRTPAGNPRRIGKIAKTRREVAEWLRAKQGELLRGGWQEPTALTFREWYEAWIAALTPNVRENTLHDYGKALEPALDLFGGARLRDLTPARVQVALNGWTGTRSAYQNRKTMRVLKACLGEATRLELLPRNPAAAVKLPRTQPKPILVWTGEEAAQVLAHARDTGHSLHTYLHVNLTTGLRREEMLGLRWQDLSFADEQLHVRQTCTYITGRPTLGEPKTRASRRTVSLDPETVQVLREHRETQDLARTQTKRWADQDLVFPNRHGDPAPESRLAKRFRELATAAGVPVIRLYDLRHTYASLAHEVGVPLKLIGERLGHTSVAFTLQTYVHVGQQQRRAAALSSAQLFRAPTRETTAGKPAETPVAVKLPSGQKDRQDAV